VAEQLAAFATSWRKTVGIEVAAGVAMSCRNCLERSILAQAVFPP